MPSDMPERRLRVLRPGRVEYDDAVVMQQRLVKELKQDEDGRDDWLILLRHPPVLTIGRRGDRGNILASADRLRAEGIQVREVGRGGDVTYHGPGQIVGYPILALRAHGKDVHGYLRRLEAVLLGTLGDFGIDAGRRKGYTGVWAGEEKIAAIGVAISSWITWHGFALNVDTNPEHFGMIVPCGIRDRKVTSMRGLLKRPVDEAEVENRLVEHFHSEFRFGDVLEEPMRQDLLVLPEAMHR